MKILFWAIGKNHDALLKTAIDDFTKRVGHYFTVSWKIFPASKSVDRNKAMQDEAMLVLNAVQPGDFMVALDEHGVQIDSVKLSAFINKQSVQSTRNLIFVIGGAYGFHNDLLKESRFVWSLSELTFPHQLVRLILAEQVYRACTILRNEKYHHS